MFSISQLSLAQSSLTGTITNSETGEPIFGANIFIENSTVGANSDPDGKFRIQNIRGSNQNVVISHIAYYSQTVSLRGRTRIDFKLKPKVTQLDNFEIEQDKDRKWKRLYRQFEEAFIGESRNASKVVVRNPWVMELEKGNGGDISGHSLDLLEIENRATGYLIQFLVEQFKTSGNEVVYSGKPYFTPIKAASADEEEEWKEAREKAYLGSRQHLLDALVKARASEEGFVLYNAEFDQRKGKFVTGERISGSEVLENGILNFEKFLKVVYTNEKPEPAFVEAFSSETRVDMGLMGSLRLEDRAATKNQISYLFIRTSKGIKLSDDAFLKNPEALLEYGYWSWERVAELLPYEYHLDRGPKN